jgi:putative Mg2+ transporter-C (MgtC) family protein
MTTLLFAQDVSGFWSTAMISTNLVVVLNLLGSLLLGVVLGYERTYHGRAAGMRTYGLVSMASTALIVVTGHTTEWFGGHWQAVGGDPTRVIQGIVTGIGFLGAGVIMKDGLNIRGLTTAASIWLSSAVGVLVGIGFYAAAIILTGLTVAAMVVILRLENWLPSHQVIGVVMRFSRGVVPEVGKLSQLALHRGYQIDPYSLAISYQDGMPEWRFVVSSVSKNRGETFSQLADELSSIEGLESFSMAHARN